MADLSEDEYDALPDPFIGINWDTIEGMNSGIPSQAQPITTQPTPFGTGQDTQTLADSPDEYDDLPDTFANVVWNGDVPVAITQSSTSGNVDSVPIQNTSQGSKRSLPSGGLSGPSSKKSKFHPAESTSSSSRPGELSDPGPSVQKKRDLQSVLKDFEDDITCPICCDILAYAQLGNPCGHCYCGECGWNWIKKSRNKPTCPICRGSLSTTAPMVPNFAMDSIVEKHIHILAETGNQEWITESDNYRNWQQRKKKWKESASERLKQSKKRRVGVPAIAIMAARAATFIYDEDPNDDDYVEEDEESYVEENGEEEPGEASSEDDTPLDLHLPPQNTTRRRLRRRRRANT